jgi:hypothetical protein
VNGKRKSWARLDEGQDNRRAIRWGIPRRMLYADAAIVVDPQPNRFAGPSADR